MSFNDLNDLEAQPASYSDQTTTSPEFTNLIKSISQRIFNITSNVALVHRYIGLLSTPRDTDKMRQSLMDTLAKTKDITKDLIPDIRSLSRWDPEEIGPSGKYEQQKLTGDFQKAATDFQNAQRLALEKQKDYVKEAKAAIDEDTEESLTHTNGHQHLQQLQQQQGIQLLDNSEIEFNEQLIEEREQEIQGIEQGITELNEIFKDLATIVVEQGSQLGLIISFALLTKKIILRPM
jgi:t-SNARE complex subunit (syntaxin)